jgi:hypothetical protein
MQDQCLKIGGKVPDLRKLFDMYHKNITSQFSWWKKKVAPHIKLRARMWEGFEIYVGLDCKLRNMPNFTNGMILIGDAAGLESTELCDGVPAAWFSAEIAAKVAIKAIKHNNTSKEFLKEYDNKIKSHPIIQWSIKARNRYDLRIAQEEHDIKKLRKYIHEGWGLGSLSRFMTPFLMLSIKTLRNDPYLLSKWIKMYFRYFNNWMHEKYDYLKEFDFTEQKSKRLIFFQSLFQKMLMILDSIMHLIIKTRKFSAWFMLPFARSVNKFMKSSLWLIEPLYLFLIKLIAPMANKLGNGIIKFVEIADKRIFTEKLTTIGEK